MLLSMPIPIDGLLGAGRYEEAEAAAREWVRTSEPGENAGLAFLTSREALAQALVANGRVAAGEATANARAALETARALWPNADAPEVARLEATLASALLAEAHHVEALALLTHALQVLRAEAAGHRLDLVNALTSYADLRIEQDDPAGALSATDEARRWITEDDASAVLGARLSDIAALAHQFQGHWDAAQDALLAAERRRAHAGQSRHPDAAVTQLLLGDAAWNAGDMTSAQTHYVEALAIADQTLRQGHPLRTRALGRLGSWEAEMGLVERALPRHREATQLARENLGPTHPRLTDYLNDLANAVMISGEPEASVPLLQEAIAIGERIHGPESAFIAAPIYNLAGAYADAGQWQAALAPMARAANIWVKAFGEDDPRVRRAYKSWADCLAGGGDDNAAVAWYERALALRLRAGERDHPATARLRGALASALERLGREREADAVAAEAERVLRDLIGWRDQELAKVLTLRARLATRRNAALAFAVRWARDGDDLRERHVRGTVRFLGERQALRYLGGRFEGRDLLLQLLASGRRDDGLARTALELVASQRGLVLDELSRRAQLTGTSHGVLDPAWVRLNAARRQMASLLYRQGPQVDQVLLAAGRALEDAERAAAWERVADRAPAQRGGVQAGRLSTQLPPGSALVSMAVFRGPGASHDSQYLAFVLRANERTPRVVSLGAAQPLEALVARWRDALRDADALGDRDHEREALRLGQQLARRVWAPLRASLGRRQRVYIVPDGVLHLVNFAALVDDHGRFLVEHGPTLHLLSSERQLLRVPRRQAPHSALIAAGPDFDALEAVRTVTSAHVADAGTVTTSGALLWRGRTASCSDLSRLEFEPLPAARREGDDVKRLLTEAHVEAAVLTSGAASEATLKRDVGLHDVVHIASHGFALDPGCSNTGGAGQASNATLSPLLFTGLALAGANRRQLAEAGDEDGILTAEEISSLRMKVGTWVVLSGCETATGGIRNAEGVMGLRRAFAMAGATTVVMSLWRVQDVYARRWMTALYQARFRDGLDTAEAVRAASRSVLQSLRASGRSTTPARWGAFVAAGDWR